MVYYCVSLGHTLVKFIFNCLIGKKSKNILSEYSNLNKIKVQSLIKIENKKSYKAPNKIEKKKIKKKTKESETFD